jgi:hypothetical protein
MDEREQACWDRLPVAAADALRAGIEMARTKGVAAA